MRPARSQWGHGAGPGFGGVRLGPPGPVPAAVKGLLVANVAIYVLQVLAGNNLISAFALVPSLVAKLELWRLFSYQFLHGGVWHLAFNCLWLWMFGSELEERWGANFFLKYYFVCGIGGGLLFTLARWGTSIPTIGASGAIFGVLMAYGMWFPNREVLLFFTFPVRVRHLVVFLIILQFIQTIEASGSGIAHAAHLGGMVIGYAYLRWWGVSGLGVSALPSVNDLRRRYLRWRLKRLQRRRFGGDGGPTIH